MIPHRPLGGKDAGEADIKEKPGRVKAFSLSSGTKSCSRWTVSAFRERSQKESIPVHSSPDQSTNKRFYFSRRLINTGSYLSIISISKCDASADA